MNIEDLREYIIRINSNDASGDYEKAHNLEDEMLWDFVRHIADIDNNSVVKNKIFAIEMLSFLEKSNAPRYSA